MHSHPMILIALAAFALASVCPAALADAAAPAPKLPDDWQVIKPIVSDDMPTGEGLFGMDLNADGSRVVLCEKRYLANEWAVIVYYWPWYTVILGGVLWLLLLVLFLRFNRRARRLAQDGCPACGYPAFDGRGDTCPECGAPVNRREPESRRTLRNAIGLAMIGMLVGVPIPTVLLLIDAPRQGSASAWYDWPSKQAVAWIKEHELEELEPLIKERHCIVFREAVAGFPEKQMVRLEEAEDWFTQTRGGWILALKYKYVWETDDEGKRWGRGRLDECHIYDGGGSLRHCVSIDGGKSKLFYDRVLDHLYVSGEGRLDLSDGSRHHISPPEGADAIIPGSDLFLKYENDAFAIVRPDGATVRRLQRDPEQHEHAQIAALSPEGKRMYTTLWSTPNNRIDVWNLETGWLPHETFHSPIGKWIAGLYYIRNRQAMLVITDDPQRLLVYDLRDRRWLGELDTSAMTDHHLTMVSADGSRVLIANDGLPVLQEGPVLTQIFSLDHFPALAARGTR